MYSPIHQRTTNQPVVLIKVGQPDPLHLQIANAEYGRNFHMPTLQSFQNSCIDAWC